MEFEQVYFGFVSKFYKMDNSPFYFGIFCNYFKDTFFKKGTNQVNKVAKPPVIYLTISLIIVSIISILDIGIEKEIIRSIVYPAFIFLSLAVARHLSSRTRLAQPAGHKKTKSKYEKSGLKQEDAVWIVDTLQDLMLKENLHLNSELKLEDLAAKIKFQNTTLPKLSIQNWIKIFTNTSMNFELIRPSNFLEKTMSKVLFR